MPEKPPMIIPLEDDGADKRLRGKVAGQIGGGYAAIFEEEEQLDHDDDEPSAEEQVELSHEELARRRAMKVEKTMAEFAASRAAEKLAKGEK